MNDADLLAHLRAPDVTLTPRGRDLAGWLELRARAPMRQPAAKANRRRPRPEQEGLANVPLFDPRLF